MSLMKNARSGMQRVLMTLQHDCRLQLPLACVRTATGEVRLLHVQTKENSMIENAFTIPHAVCPSFAWDLSRSFFPCRPGTTRRFASPAAYTTIFLLCGTRKGIVRDSFFLSDTDFRAAAIPSALSDTSPSRRHDEWYPNSTVRRCDRFLMRPLRHQRPDCPFSPTCPRHARCLNRVLPS